MHEENFSAPQEIKSEREQAISAGLSLQTLIQQHKEGKPFAVLLGGPLGAGKTRLSQAVQTVIQSEGNDSRFALFDIDDEDEVNEYIRAHGSREGWDVAKWDILKNRYKEALESGISVVVTATFYQPDTRETYEQLVQDTATHAVQGIWLNVSEQTSIARQKERTVNIDDPATIEERTHIWYENLQRLHSLEHLDTWSFISENETDTFYAAANLLPVSQ